MTPGQTVAHAALSATLATTLNLFALTGDRLAWAATNGHRGGNYVAGVNGPILVLLGRGGLGQTGPTEGEIVAVQRGRVVGLRHRRAKQGRYVVAGG